MTSHAPLNFAVMSRTYPSKTNASRTHHSDLNQLCSAVATGDIEIVKQKIKDGAGVNQRASDGSLPLCTAAFWGYADIVDLLLENNADINGRNETTGWTATHCAAFQGHGRVLMFLTSHNPDVAIKDTFGRTAVDFASVREEIWPFFSGLEQGTIADSEICIHIVLHSKQLLVMGCVRTPKEQLVKLDVIKKAPTDQSNSSDHDAVGMAAHRKPLTRYSRPGSSYVLSLNDMSDGGQVDTMTKPSAAKLYGDVLSEES